MNSNFTIEDIMKVHQFPSNNSSCSINETEANQPASLDDSQLRDKLSQLFSFLQNLNNQIYQKSIKELVTQCNEKGIEHLLRITKLNLSHCELEAIPEEVGLLTHLEELSLIDNKLSHLPDSIGALQNLRKVEIEMNRFEEIPQVIHHLALQKINEKKFFELYLRDNPMKNVPSDIKPIVRSLPNFSSYYS